MTGFYIITAVFILIIVYSIIENRYIKTVCYTVQLSQERIVRIKQQSDAKGKTRSGSAISIVQLSDLHNCRYGEQNRRLLDGIERCKPDVILLTGDIINKYKPVPEDIYNLFEQLVKLCPCVYSLGNHELKERKKNPEGFSEYIKNIKKCGIIVSDNEIHRIKIKDTPLLFASYSSDLVQYRKNVCKKNVSADWTEIPKTNGNEVAILLSHDPELTERYIATTYSIIFSGHLHGGIVRIPGWRGIISTRFVLFPGYDGGCYSLDDKHVLVVSRGLGSHTIKFRLFNRPELVHTVIELEE